VWVDFPRSRIIPVSDTGMEADFRHSFAGLKLMLHPLTHTFAPVTADGKRGKTPGPAQFFIRYDAAEYDSVSRCPRHPSFPR